MSVMKTNGLTCRFSNFRLLMKLKKALEILSEVPFRYYYFIKRKRNEVTSILIRLYWMKNKRTELKWLQLCFPNPQGIILNHRDLKFSYRGLYLVCFGSLVTVSFLFLFEQRYVIFSTDVRYINKYAKILN